MQQNMRLRHAFYVSLMALGYAGSASATDVTVCTDLGNFSIELLDQQSPAHAANFLDYVDRGYYIGTVFHRVIGGFMVQGGGYTREFRNKITSDPVMNESKNGIGNSRGTVAAARTGDPHSATSQFFVNLENNPSLNASGDDWGYSVFGQVTQGMDVVDAIAALPTGPDGPFPTDVTDPLVAITSMARVVDQIYPTLSADERHAALQQDIETAVAAGDNDEAADLFSAYRAACGEFGPELLYTEANVLAAVGRNAAASICALPTTPARPTSKRCRYREHSTQAQSKKHPPMNSAWPNSPRIACSQASRRFPTLIARSWKIWLRLKVAS
jgi:cyclophilin family peptidyl-prolyl cis-trans isomerase